MIAALLLGLVDVVPLAGSPSERKVQRRCRAQGGSI
jgi:hypothetical protein